MAKKPTLDSYPTHLLQNQSAHRNYQPYAFHRILLELSHKIKKPKQPKDPISIISIVTFAFPGYCSGLPTGFFFQSYVYD